jgi:alpha/beta superfamily hydrolase
MTEALTFPSSDGLTLEGELDTVDGAPATLLFCHPHPKMGGTMNAPLLMAVRDAMVATGWNVLRFNFRGIGASEGTSSTGSAEIQDAEGALEEARALGVPVALAGWSFGAAVALRLAGRADDIIGCVAIAPAIDEKPGITEGVPADVEPRCPVLLVIGVNDDLVDPSRAREWAAEHSAEFHEMKGANHFFWAKYDGLTSLVSSWLVKRP